MPDVGLKRIYRLATAYTAAIAGPVVVGWFRYTIQPWAEDQARLVFFTLPVAVAASFGGIRPGIIATLLSLMIGTFFFIGDHSWTIADTGSAVNILGFAFTWLFICLGGDALISRRREVRRAADLVSISEARLTNLLRNISGGFYVIDKSRRITLVNHAILDQLKTSEREVVGRTIDEVFGTDAQLVEAIERVGITHEPEVFEWLDGDRWYQMRLSPDPTGDTIAVFVHDITLQKELQEVQERLLETERNLRSEVELESRRKDDFVATLSHELRTPLTAIVGWAEILRDRVADDDPNLVEGLGVIERSARLQAGLIDDLLDLSRIVTGQLKLHKEVLDLCDLVAEAVRSQASVADLKGCWLEWVPPEEDIFVYGDPMRLNQVVVNLISNSIKFTEAGGSIAVCVRREGDQAVIEVEDEGQGIPPDLLPHIFDRFRQGHSGSTRKHGGLGLGLAIVHQLVQHHGGSVMASSSGVGKGSSFEVKIPVTAGLPTSRLPLPDVGQLLEGIRVLVVEDDEASRRVIEQLCEMRGATVLACPSARDALLRIDGFRPDVIVSDVGMPDMDGHQFLRRVRTLPEPLCRVPAIALTAFARAEDRDAALEAGFDVHMAKPINSAHLFSAIKRLGVRA